MYLLVPGRAGSDILLVDNRNDDETELYLLNRDTEYENLSPTVTRDHFGSACGEMSSWALSAPVILPWSNHEGYPVQTSQMSPLIHEVNEKPGPQCDCECTRTYGGLP